MNAPIPELLLSEAAERFRLLGDPVRLRILNLLLERGDVAVQDIASATGQSHQNASKHLRKLSEGGLLGCRRDGLHTLYHVSDPSLPGLCMLVCGALRERDRS